MGHSPNGVLSQTCAALMQVCSGKDFSPFSFHSRKFFRISRFRPVGLVVPNNSPLKCGKTSSFKRSLLKVKMVLSGYWLPRLVDGLRVPRLRRSVVSRKAQQIQPPAVGGLYSVTAVKMSSWFNCEILRCIPCVVGIVRFLHCSSCTERARGLRCALR